MSLNGLSSPKYQTSVQQKIHSRNVAKNLRHGMPQLKSVLREKFRQRLKECRHNSYQNLRNLNQDGYIEEIIRRELQELEYDINLQESIYKELLADINEWLVAEQDEEETYLESIGDNSDVFCPVCQKSVLHMNAAGQCYCKCGVNFNFEGGSDKLNVLLQRKINEHEQRCQEQLIFFVEPQSDACNRLSGMCDKCDFFLTI